MKFSKHQKNGCSECAIFKFVWYVHPNSMDTFKADLFLQEFVYLLKLDSSLCQ